MTSRGWRDSPPPSGVEVGGVPVSGDGEPAAAVAVVRDDLHPAGGEGVEQAVLAGGAGGAGGAGVVAGSAPGGTY